MPSAFDPKRTSHATEPDAWTIEPPFRANGVNWSAGWVPGSTIATIDKFVIFRLPRNIEVMREVQMPRLITRGRFTQDYAKRLVGSPEDREPAVRKLVEASGGKLISFYFTTGDSDFMLITEGETESAIAALMAAAAAGMICDMSTSRAWTGAEFKSVADKAAKVTGEYRPPGK